FRDPVLRVMDIAQAVNEQIIKVLDVVAEESQRSSPRLSYLVAARRKEKQRRLANVPDGFATDVVSARQRGEEPGERDSVNGAGVQVSWGRRSWPLLKKSLSSPRQSQFPPSCMRRL